MEEIVELSSDSNDTTVIIWNNENDLNKDSENLYDLSSFEDNEQDFKNVLPSSSRKRNTLEGFNADIEGDQLLSQVSDLLSTATSGVNVVKDADNLLKELSAKYLPTKDATETYSNENKDYDKSHLKRKLSVSSLENENNPNKIISKKQMLQNERIKRKLEQQHKKELIEKEKAMKKTLKASQKSINPDECLKNIIVQIDETILMNFGENITEKLNNNEVSYKSIKQVCSGVISWIWKVQTIDNLVGQLPISEEKHYLLILSCDKFKSFVNNNDLNTFVNSVALQLKFKHLTIVVFELDKLNEKQEYAVIEVEMFHKCYWQFVKNLDDLASLIFTITKAVAQIPYKLEKQEKYRLHNEYLADSNKDTVKVDKNYNGLTRLWNQMLTMLPLARLETADAITSVYPTPSSLFKAYEDCELDKEGMIKNLPIRRTNGPLVAVRKIGPELSKKCANLFTSTENVYV